MSDPALLITLASAGLLALAIAATAALRGWQDWLELRRLELSHGRPATPKGRPDLTDLRARVRRLESIANGSEG